MVWTVLVATPSMVAAVRPLLNSETSALSLRSLKLTSPVLSVTFAFMRDVVIVKVPALSVTQKLGVPQLALTESDALLGMDEAFVYSTRTMSAWQT